MSERPLPMAADEGSPKNLRGDDRPAPVQLESSSVRLVSTLTVAGALAGLAIVSVFGWANPRIEAWRAEVLSAAITEVLSGAERYETVFLDGSTLTRVPLADTAALDRVYVGYDAYDEVVGVAVVGAEPGFQDVIRLIFGYDPGGERVIGMKVLESKETPGLGDKIEKDSTFLAEFGAADTPLTGVKEGRESGSESEITLITGATISSRAIVDIINHRLEALDSAILGYWQDEMVRTGGAP
jgi:electron transport complex protein RnfG